MITDEMIIAYVDRELGESDLAEVEMAMENDPAVQARVEAQIRLRERIGDAFAGVAAEPVPAHLVRAAKARTVSAPGQVVDLAAARASLEKKAQPPARSGPKIWAGVLVAVAAAAIFLVVAPNLGKKGGGTEQLVALDQGQMVATGPLLAALDKSLASAPPPGAPVRIGLTYRSKQARWCRSFSAAAGLTGLACRDNGSWKVAVLASGAPSARAGGFQTAASTVPAAVQAAIDASVAGEPLDAAAERKARDSRWGDQ